MRRTKIVATLGPASNSYEMIEALSEAGVDIFRLNFSHGTHESQGEMIKKIKRLNQKSPKSHAILLDTKGPEIRSGDLKVPIEVQVGDRLVFSPDPGDYDLTGKIGVNYDEFVNDVEVGEKVLLDSGVIGLSVLEKTGHDVICEVLDEGVITSRRHINIPGKDVSLESITEKDWADIKFGVEMGVDIIALSFVRKSDEILELKNYLQEQNAKIEVMAKIESFEATKHLGTICEAADSLMVARGDLGAEVPFEQVPKLQREIIETSAQYGKPVIVATHMLESMIENPVPTRAEVSDVSTAVWQRADATMLSGESANGEYPIKSVEAMSRVATTTESEFLETRPMKDLPPMNNRGVFAKTGCQMAHTQSEIEALVVITRSGETAQRVARFRPRVPIFAFTNEPGTRRRLGLNWGVEAFRIEFSSTPQTTILRAREAFIKKYPEWKGKKYVLISDFLVDEEFVPTLQIREF